MPPDDQDLETPEGEEPAAAAPAAPAAPPTLSLTSDQARQTPEFKALEKENRRLARRAGSAEAAAAAARTQAEEARQAAEAEQQAALEQQLIAALGADGVAAYTEIAELSINDPMAAALRVAELVAQAQGQTQPAPAPGTAEPGKEEGEPVAANASASAPPPPSGGLDGGAPLGQASTGEDVDQIVNDLTKEYADVVARNQDPRSRNRVTMKERAKGFIGYLGASYLKAGAKPKSP